MSKMTFVMGVITALGFIACSNYPHATAPEQEQPIAESETVSVSMKLSIPQSLAGIISRVEYVISAEDMETMSGELNLEADSTARGTVTGIKEGEDRLFTLNGYDESNTITHTGSTTTDIIAGQTTEVRIEMGSLAGTAEILGEITETPESETTQSYTASSYPFLITLEKFEILPDDQIKLTLSFTNVTQDTLLSIQASIGTNAQDNQGNSYSYSGGWSRHDWVVILPENSTKVFVFCKSDNAVETEGTEFTVSVHFRYWCKVCDTDITAVGFIEVKPN